MTITSATACSASTSIRHGSWFQRGISWRFCSSRTTLFPHTNTTKSTWRHVKAFLNPYSRMGDCIYHLAHYMLAAGVLIRQRGLVHHVHRHRCKHGLNRLTSSPSRSHRSVALLRLTPHFSPVADDNTSALSRHITTDYFSFHLFTFRKSVQETKSMWIWNWSDTIYSKH